MRKILSDGNGGWRKVPITIYISTTGFLFTIICTLIAWSWSGHLERAIIARELAAQFEKQADAAAKRALEVGSEASARMDRIQADYRALRDDLTRHMDADSQRFADRRR